MTSCVESYIGAENANGPTTNAIRIRIPSMQNPIFDGHNDLLVRLMQRCAESDVDSVIKQCIAGDARGQIDLPRMQAGRFAGGLFAVFIPPENGSFSFEKMGDGGYKIPLPPPLPYKNALPVAMHQVRILLQLIEQSQGALVLCTSRKQIDQCLQNQTISVVLHMEGAEAIDEDLHALDVFYAAGLRSLGPVWSRNTLFADGVPLAFPATPDIGGGLTEAGKRLVAKCNKKHVLIDLSHLNEKGFWDVAKLSNAPLVATHSNVWSVCNSARNLTDKQLDAIRESNGVVGMNLATCFIRPDGKMTSDTDLSQFLQHIDAALERLGDTRVALGSDFDGAVMPKAIGDIGGLDALREAFTKHGYDDALQSKLCYTNWLDALERTWGE